MVQYIPPPDPQALLPPILACIPTAFLSPRPPPALPPLLSPILRQRLQYLGATSSSPSESWLPYLCWDADAAKRLVEIVADSDAFEPHPTSGQIKLGDIEEFTYRRLDEETLHARVATPATQLEFIFLWHAGEEGDEDNNIWLIAEVKPYSSTTGSTWYTSVTEAEEAAHAQAFDEATHEGDHAATGLGEPAADENDYWAQYDKTPARSPEHDHTTAPPDRARRGRTTSEAEYFNRYADVQPEMDNEDPSQSAQETGPSTLNGHEVASSGQREMRTLQQAPPAPSEQREPSLSTLPQTNVVRNLIGDNVTDGQLSAETATRQHVSSNLKSLFKLCRGVGMERAEFEELVTTELQALSMLEDA